MDNSAELDSGETRNLIRTLSDSQAMQFLNYYKDLFLNSIEKGKSEPEKEELYEKIKKLSYVHNKIDPTCILQIKKRLVRIEYPGVVLNLNKAIETLGGIKNIESSVADQRSKLELKFHFRNNYSKPAIGERNFNPGILLKVNKRPMRGEKSSSDEEQQLEYKVEGVSVINFSFNSN